MNRLELLDDLNVALLKAQQFAQAGIWTALPGIVQSYDPGRITAEVQPATLALVTVPPGGELGPGMKALVKAQRDATTYWVAMPLLVDCPVVFPRGGGFTLTFPLKPGDECLVIFSSRSIDYWWQQGGMQPQVEMRMHDLSDGFVIPGPTSQPRVMSPAPAINAVELRADDRSSFVRITESGNIDITSTGGEISMNAPKINLVGDVKITGPLDVTGDMTNKGKRVGADIIVTGVDSGTSTSSGVL